MLDHKSLPGQNILSTEMPEIRWEQGDDHCNCTFQRLGFWTNPYIGRTLRVRICCIWAELYKDYPQFVQEIPAFENYSDGDKYEYEPHEWNGEADMPAHLWHRQLAVLRNEPIEDIRERFENVPPPKGTPRPKVVAQREVMSEHEIIGQQVVRIQALESETSQLVSLIHALVKEEIPLDHVELTDNGFTVKEDDAETP